MLVKLLPDQISNGWDLIRFAVAECTPEITAAGLNVVLEELLDGAMQCWWEILENDGFSKLYAVVITSIHYDRFFRQNCLRLCCLYGYDDLSPQQYQEAYETLKGFAQGQDCIRIEAFTNREGLPEMAKKFGFNVDFHISKEI